MGRTPPPGRKQAQACRFAAVNPPVRKKLLPLGIKNPVKTELPALVALEAIGQPWFGESHRADLLATALVSQRLAVEGSYIHTIAGELIAVLGADELKIDVVRPLVVDILAWLQVQPNARVDEAIGRLLKQQSGKPE